MLPNRSPYSLIQEDLWPDEWKCLVACVMLNCTTRRQVEKVLPVFFRRWPTAADVSQANPDEVSQIISTLGFKNRRTASLIRLAKEYSKKNWTHVHELPGIGEYASRMWEMFFLNFLGDDKPHDGALTMYWVWRKRTSLSSSHLPNDKFFNDLSVDEKGEMRTIF